VKLGPQEFLMSTLEQMADRISESHEFGEVATAESPEPAVAETVETQKAKSSGPFRLLKGFWN
jgi:hypothetical protein